MIMEFNSYLEDTAPTVFIVPDTGLPGAEAVLTFPDGTSGTVEQVETTEPREWPWLGKELPGIVFEMPVFTVEGDHVLTVTQPDASGPAQVTTYLVHVKHDPDRYTPQEG